jgi:hypothetical protein
MVKYQKEKITLEDKFGVLRLNHTILVFLLLLSGCQSRHILPKSTGTEYFPLKIGAYWVYNVSETTITQLGGQTNTLYDLKVQISDSVLLSGQWSYVMERFTRNDASQPWVSAGTWSARHDAFKAVLQEGNIPFIKLSFPLLDGKMWDGNALNNLGGPDRCANGTVNCDNYAVADLAKRFEGQGISFDDTVTIIENNDNDPIVKQDVRKSVYAKTVGLVYSEVTILQYCTVGACIGQQIVENGSIVKQTIEDYGGL